MRLLLCSLLVIYGCSGGLQTVAHGVTVSEGGKAKDHITQELCVEPEEAARWAGVAWPLLLHNTIAQGYLKAPQLRQYVTSSRLGVKACLIAKPAVCHVAGSPAGPCETVDGKRWCARKAGCAYYNHVWASKAWPPMCEDNAKGEWNRNCAQEYNSGYNWRATLIHELGNVLRLRYLRGEGYDGTSTTKFFAAGGPVSETRRMLAESQ